MISKIRNYKFSVLITFIFISQSCTVSQKEIESQGWKLADIRECTDRIDTLVTGRDVLDFRQYMSVRGDTIYKNSIPYALIIDRKHGFILFESNSIEVVDLLTKDTLRYVAKWTN
jgi:hypothetical protein